MVYGLVKEAYFEGVGTIFYVCAPLDKAITLFNTNGLQLITARELAVARIDIGNAVDSLLKYGSRIREGPLYIPKSSESDTRIILVRNSLVLTDPVAATNSHRRNEEYSVSDEKVKRCLHIGSQNSKDFFVVTNTRSIPTTPG